MPEQFINLNCANCGGKLEVYDDNSALKAALLKNGEIVTGCVFYTRQAASKLQSPAKRSALVTAPLESPDLGVIGLPAREVGTLVVAALVANHAKYDWNGDTGKKIKVPVEA